MPILVEVREVKRLSRRVKTRYMPLQPGDIWMDVPINGERVTITADKYNTHSVFVGRKR